MKKNLKINLLITFVLVILGQIIFFVFSPKFLQVSYSNNIYATIGVQTPQENFQSLAEAANQFGQTLNGWLKFPNFMANLSKKVPLPEGSSISSFIQERQNVVISLATPTWIKKETLVEVENYIQSKIDAYNAVSKTSYVLTQLDFEQVTHQKSYKFGATVTLIFTLILAGGIWFLRKEMM